MSTLVLAIETVGNDWDSFAESAKESLVKSHLKDNLLSPEHLEIKDHKQRLLDKLSLSPFTGQIISLAMYDIERDLGAVYFVSEYETGSFNDNSFTYKVRTEREIIEDFWEGANSYDTFVTFNGRSFTLPFLYHRSAIHKIKLTIEIARERSVLHQTLPYHVDLLDEMTRQGNVQPRPTLAVLANAYGVDYQPACSGEAVTEFFRQKKFRDLANRNATNVTTITTLYKIWKQYLAPIAFINTLEM